MEFLVVDDSSTMRQIIKNSLLRLGYENIFEGDDGIQGWNILDKCPNIGMLITDWNMPEMDGLEFIRKVRADIRFTHLPIIMVTMEGGKTEVIAALKAGVNNYIIKPFTPQVLNEKLSAALGI